MAKRRDGVSRRMTKAVKQARRENKGQTPPNPIRQSRGMLNVVRSLAYANENDTLASIRYRGRRGVRARARNARIQARQVNGTYRQPSGGGTTNS